MNIKIISGDITKVNVDAIVNAANASLLGGGGVDGAIHRAAGPELLEECKTLHGCHTGNSKITKGYKLAAKFVIHTVGPIYLDYTPDESKKLLESCYKTSLDLAKENGCKTVAFPLISAGIYGYPKAEALDVALSVIRSYNDFDEVQIVLFDRECYSIAKKNYPELLLK